MCTHVCVCACNVLIWFKAFSQAQMLVVIITIALVCVIFESLKVFYMCVPFHNYIVCQSLHWLVHVKNAVINDKRHSGASKIVQGDYKTIAKQFGKWCHTSCCCEEAATHTCLHLTELYNITTIIHHILYLMNDNIIFIIYMYLKYSFIVNMQHYIYLLFVNTLINCMFYWVVYHLTTVAVI